MLLPNPINKPLPNALGARLAICSAKSSIDFCLSVFFQPCIDASPNIERLKLFIPSMRFFPIVVTMPVSPVVVSPNKIRFILVIPSSAPRLTRLNTASLSSATVPPSEVVYDSPVK